MTFYNIWALDINSDDTEISIQGSGYKMDEAVEEARRMIYKHGYKNVTIKDCQDNTILHRIWGSLNEGSLCGYTASNLTFGEAVERCRVFMNNGYRSVEIFTMK
jgi:hypothetical protein